MLTPGFPGTLAAYAKYAKQHGAKKMALIATDGPGVIAGASALGAPVFKKEGVGLDVVAVPVDTADMSPQLQSAVSGGADALAVVGDLTFCSSFFKAYQTLALTVKRYVIATCIDPTTVQAYSDVLAGSVMAGLSSKDLTTKDKQTYAAIIQKYGPSGMPTDPTQNTGDSSGVEMVLSLVNLMKGYTGTVDAAGVMQQIQTAKDVPIPLSGGSTFTCDGKAIPVLKNVCSGSVGLGVLDAQGRLGKPQQIDVSPLFAN
jgi:branched-chain amino acid transport system substrate-binding protein